MSGGVRPLLVMAGLCVALGVPEAFAAKGTAPTPHAKVSSGCVLSDAGIQDQKGFETFFFGFKKAVKENDFNQISEYAFYPLRITSRFGIHTIASKAELMPLIRIAMNEKVKKAVESQSISRLTCNDEGVSFGQGRVWVAQRGKKIGVFAIELN